MKKVSEKLPVTSHAVRIVVPNDLVSKIIGKGGAAIKKLQGDSGATVQVAKELATDHMPVGRAITLSGTVAQIATAHYKRSAERRVGKVCGSTCRYRWSSGI